MNIIVFIIILFIMVYTILSNQESNRKQLKMIDSNRVYSYHNPWTELPATAVYYTPKFSFTNSIPDKRIKKHNRLRFKKAAKLKRRKNA
ncbi:hypothetical protein I5M32_11290 [Pedobacter sp. SD-b]|uniref:Uncharacterized protein n=1 Tax=Pedobacter segetis TaxID=2793069 RepID=A0ABS1BLC5_9SPHI|nr:hypothetical protein [Pedobacter segetis]MBK0383541.1 hypothetical protein [Pedobacter segetis]